MSGCFMPEVCLEWLAFDCSGSVWLGKIRVNFANTGIFRNFMSLPTDHTATSPAAAAHEEDVVESIAHVAPMILPIVGGVLMFLLAFIAVFLA